MVRIAARRVFWMFFILLGVGREATAQGLVTTSGTTATRAVGFPLRPLGRPMPVAVFAPLEIRDSLVNRICAEAEASWRPAGLTFECYRVTSADTVRPWWLKVTIDERRQDMPEGQMALGWIPFTPDGPKPSIHLSRASTEDLLLRTPGLDNGVVLTHELLLGRALGRALSHELGHYFLSSKAHTPHGLMRAVRSSEEFFRMSRDGFELTEEEREAAALHITW